MAKRKTNWPLLGAVVGICAAPFTGGASLAMAGKVLIPTLAASAGLGFVGGKVVEATVDNGSSGSDNLNQNLEAWKLQMDQWQNLVKSNQEEAKRLREEKEENNKKLKFNNEEITRLNAVINNPHASDEEKKNARKQIAILEDENKHLKNKLDKIDGKIDALSKNPPVPSKPWTWPELKTIDKVLLTGGTVLLIYLLIPENKKK